MGLVCYIVVFGFYLWVLRSYLKFYFRKFIEVVTWRMDLNRDIGRLMEGFNKYIKGMGENKELRIIKYCILCIVDI